VTEKSTEKNGNANTTKSFLAAKVAAGPLSWDNAPPAGMTLKNLDLDSLDPNPEQARKNFDEDQLFELASSILVRGLLTPISVSPEVENLGRSTGRHYIVAGERRVRSFRMLRDAAKNEATARHMAERARKHYTGEEGESLAQLWLGLAGSTEALQKFATIPAIVEAAKDSAARLLDGLTENLRPCQGGGGPRPDGGRARRKAREGCAVHPSPAPARRMPLHHPQGDDGGHPRHEA